MKRLHIITCTKAMDRYYNKDLDTYIVEDRDIQIDFPIQFEDKNLIIRGVNAYFNVNVYLKSIKFEGESFINMAATGIMTSEGV